MSSSWLRQELVDCRAGSLIPPAGEARNPPYRFSAIARAAAGLVRLYQLTLSPALVALNPACGCRFSPTCSHYARTAFEQHGFFSGLLLTGRRLAKCGPWHPGGEDPVPVAPRFTCRAVAAAPASRPASLS